MESKEMSKTKNNLPEGYSALEGDEMEPLWVDPAEKMGELIDG